MTLAKSKSLEAVDLTAEQTKLQFGLLCALWIFISFKPEWTIPGLRPIAPLGGVIQLALLGLWFISPAKRLGNPLTKWFLFMLIVMVVSTALARNNGIGRNLLKGMILFYITYLATTTFANNEKRVFFIMNVFNAGGVFIAILSILGGGLARGVTIYADENDLALAMNIFFPIALFLAIQASGLQKKLYYFTCAGIFLMAIVTSDSRGGLVGLAAVLFLIWWKLPKGRIKATIIVLIIVIILASFAPQAYWDEMSQILQGRDESTGTGEARIYLWKVAFAEYLDHPILGVGISNFGIWLPEYAGTRVLKDERSSGVLTHWGRVCHSIYFTVLAELGTLGIAIFAIMVYHFYKELRLSRELKDTMETTVLRGDLSEQDMDTVNALAKCRAIGAGLACSMVGFLVSGVFLTVIYYSHFWLLCGLGVAVANCRKQLVESLPVVTENA